MDLLSFYAMLTRMYFESDKADYGLYMTIRSIEHYLWVEGHSKISTDFDRYQELSLLRQKMFNTYDNEEHEYKRQHR